MTELCDLCGSARLIPAHEPEETARGLTVYVCEQCGLVQSLPRIDRVASRSVRVSVGADWGNVRYGKALRLDVTLATLSRAFDLRSVRHCLDVGSSRGSFALALLEAAPEARVRAIEPDGRIVASYAGHARIDLVRGRLEDITLPDGSFDLIHCSHTLEHVLSPWRALAKLRRALSPDGRLFVEVPCLDFIGGSDVIEEWFLDKHLFHFTRPLLARYLALTGFDVGPGGIHGDGENITAIATPVEIPYPGEIRDEQEVRRSLTFIARYQRTVAANRKRLRRAVRALNHLGKTRIVVWGAGRLFDSMVRFGGLDPGRLTGVVDSHLVRYVDSVHGRPVVDPKRLAALQPDLIVIASRTYFDEIRRQAAGLVPDCATVGFTELLEVPAHMAAEGC
jgi:SAM-dependent methyltransferase